MIRFMSLSSGSCGNCYFISTERAGREQVGIIIDAGVSLRRMKKILTAEGYSYDSFSSILVTHDHLDHIRHLGSYCKTLCKPVYATSVLHNALSSHSFTRDHISSCRQILRDDDWTVIVPGRVMARYFIVPHDATQTVGYALEVDGYRMVVMTDMGRMTQEALQYACTAGTVVIESNYDPDMLAAGSYPLELQRRIRMGNGHLSNAECAEAITSFYHPELRHIFLCHLSENNNTPEKAYEASCRALGSIGMKPTFANSSLFTSGVGNSVTLRTLPRQTASTLFTLD